MMKTMHTGVYVKSENERYEDINSALSGPIAESNYLSLKIISFMLLVIFSHAVFSAEPRPPLFSSPLPNLPPDQEVVMVEITVPPGGGADGSGVGAHRHDAYVYVYMVAGTLDMQVAGGEVKRVTAGQVFIETPNDVHVMGKNPSDTEPAKFVAFMIKTIGAPLSKAVKLKTP